MDNSSEHWREAVRWHRFFSQIDMGDGCWEFRGSLNCKGYGRVRHSLGGVKTFIFAHRLSFEFFNGPIPDGHCVCHRCDNKKCVNPAHLFAGVNAENAQDAASKGLCHRPAGEKGSNARLTRDQVEQIRALLAAGTESKSAIGRRFGVGDTCIYKIYRGYTWKD